MEREEKLIEKGCFRHRFHLSPTLASHNSFIHRTLLEVLGTSQFGAVVMQSDQPHGPWYEGYPPWTMDVFFPFIFTGLNH
jgi:hypothetical protein